jgi:hypothetical protein
MYFVSPSLKETIHARDDEPAPGDDDQNRLDGVERKAVESMSGGAACVWSTRVCSSSIVGRRQPVPPRLLLTTVLPQ